MENYPEWENYTEEERRQLDEEARIEAREAHRKVLSWIADVEEMLASDLSSAKLKQQAANFLPSARRVAKWQKRSLSGGDDDGDGREFIRDFRDMIRFLDEINETLAEEESQNV